MVITPEDLANESRAEFKKELIYLDKIIQDHLFMNYSFVGCKMSGIEIEKLKLIVKKQLIENYNKCRLGHSFWIIFKSWKWDSLY